MAIKPEDMLKKSMGKEISISLRDGKSFTGTLMGFDEYDNVIMENITQEGKEGTIESAVFKGGNIVYISST